MNDSNNRGIGFAGLLTIVFITLKLTGVIDWSWWWVLAPLWVGAVLILALLLSVFLGTVVAVAVTEVLEARRRKRSAKVRASRISNGQYNGRAFSGRGTGKL